MKLTTIICVLIFTSVVGLPFLTSAMLQPQVFIVNAGGSLQAAIDQAAYGDTIIVQARASFAPIVLRAKAGRGTLNIKTSGTLPAAGTQIGPAHESQLAKVVTKTEAPAIEAEADAHDYKLSGLIVTNVGGSVWTPEIVLIGSRSSSGGIPVARLPHHIWFDQCWVREATNGTTAADSPNTTADRGFNIAAPFITLTNGRVEGFRAYKGLTATSGAESSNAVLIGATSNFVAINMLFEAWFVPFFMQPSTGSPNQATLSNPTYDAATHTWGADFSNVANLQMGDLVALRTTCGRDLTDGITAPCGHTPATHYSHPNEGVAFQVGKVNTISGNHVTGQSWGSYDGDIRGGNPLLQLPDSPGLAQWKGYTNTHITIQRCQFVIAFSAAETVWTHSGNPPGSPTTAPRSSQLNAGNAPKSHIEIKSATDVLIDGNTFDGWYTSAMLLTPRNQSNSMNSGSVPWAGDFDIKFTNNYVKRMKNWDRIYSYAIGGPQLEDNEFTSVRSGPVLIQNNLFAGGMEAFLSAMGAADNVSVIHNTYPGSTLTGSSMIIGQGMSSNNFVLKDNILSNNNYGLNNQTPAGTIPWPGIVQNHNVIIDNRSPDNKIGDGPLKSRCPNDFIAANQAAVGWDANWRLLPTSPYKAKASDGKDPGVDLDQLLAALGGTTLVPTPHTMPTRAGTPVLRPSSTKDP